MMHQFLVGVIACIVPFTELLGAAVVIWGSLHGRFMLLRRVWHDINKQPAHGALRDIRIAIGEKMSFGLGHWVWIPSLPATSFSPL